MLFLIPRNCGSWKCFTKNTPKIWFNEFFYRLRLVICVCLCVLHLLKSDVIYSFVTGLQPIKAELAILNALDVQFTLMLQALAPRDQCLLRNALKVLRWAPEPSLAFLKLSTKISLELPRTRMSGLRLLGLSVGETRGVEHTSNGFSSLQIYEELLLLKKLFVKFCLRSWQEIQWLEINATDTRWKCRRNC